MNQCKSTKLIFLNRVYGCGVFGLFFLMEFMILFKPESMNRFILFYTVIQFSLSAAILQAQVGINTDGSDPDASSMLDVKSSERGVLVPRMSQGQINLIVDPADGLLVYNTDDHRFYFYDGGSDDWKEIPIGLVSIPALGSVTNPVTGETWLDRNLGASQVANGSTDVLAYGDLYQWGRLADGHQVRSSNTTTVIGPYDAPGHPDFILAPSLPYDWRSPQNDILWQGVNGVNNPCPTGYRLPTESEFNTEVMSWSSPDAAGAFSSPLKLTLGGYRLSSNGALVNVGNQGNYWLSTIQGSDAKGLLFDNGSSAIGGNARAVGMSVRCIKEHAPGNYLIGSGGLCTNTMVNGYYTEGVQLNASNNVVIEVNVTEPGTWNMNTPTLNGYAFSGSGTFVSTGVYQVTLQGNGTPLSLQTDPFTVTDANGGGSCTFDVHVHVEEVLNSITGKSWMDRNLGALQVATSSSDANAYGDLYQWGRSSDGHQLRNSTTTAILSNQDLPGHGLFIVSPNSPNDWRSPQNDGLWQGGTGINNPCPTGFRLPTESEFSAEINTWSTYDATGAFGSELKLTTGGYRNAVSGDPGNVGTHGYYWMSTLSGTNAKELIFDLSGSGIGGSARASGASVRCIKETPQASFSIGNGGSCSNTIINGEYIEGQLLDGSNTILIEVNVTSPGLWSIASDFHNDLDFSGSGEFLATGTQWVALEGNGTPFAPQTDLFTATAGNGGGTCTFDITVAASEVTNPDTGRSWMDKNLGADIVANSSDDEEAYGFLFQWGRLADGHEYRSSDNAYETSPTDNPGHDYFIIWDDDPFDWRSPQNDALWQGLAGTNNPCPEGFRLPTEVELSNEMESWSSQDASGAFDSVLKLTVGGYRDNNDGQIQTAGSSGHYWSSTVNGTGSVQLYFDAGSSDVGPAYRSLGLSVRCIRD